MRVTLLRYGAALVLLGTPVLKLRVATGRHVVTLKPKRGAGKDIPVTISVGVADMSGDMTENLQFIKGADANLYKAKKAGRNRVTG